MNHFNPKKKKSAVEEKSYHITCEKPESLENHKGQQLMRQSGPARTGYTTSVGSINLLVRADQNVLLAICPHLIEFGCFLRETLLGRLLDDLHKCQYLSADAFCARSNLWRQVGQVGRRERGIHLHKLKHSVVYILILPIHI